MRNFDFLSSQQEKNIFYKSPTVITKHTPKHILSYGVGAALYMPGIRQDIADIVLTKKITGLTSLVLCLEDAIGDDVVEEAEVNVVKQLRRIYHVANHFDDLPFLFVRVRSPRQMAIISDGLGDALDVLTGFVFPKFDTTNALTYLDSLDKIANDHHVILYGMPILETPDILYRETRLSSLLNIKQVIDRFKDYILNIRIGATDLCGLYGIRRNYQTTIYDISVIREVITDIINLFSRDYVVSGPVWEYFENTSRIMKPELRQTPFRDMYGEEGLKVRSQLVNQYIDGLIKETLLDLANGIHGKTIIHPTHVKVVQSLYVVSKEDYLDAISIIDNTSGHVGVLKSDYENKMNEIKPHLKWAQKILIKSDIYGVYHEKHNYIDLLAEPQHVAHSR